MNEGSTEFLRRSGGFARKHAATGALALAISFATSTVVPMIEQWHTEKNAKEELRAMEERFNRRIEELKSEVYKNREHIWQAINNKRDK